MCADHLPTCHGEGKIISDPCPTCGGEGMEPKKVTLSVRIPPGAEDGMRLRVSGEGEPSTSGGPRGDLYVYIGVKEHEQFERRGLDVICKVPVTLRKRRWGET